MFSRLRNNVARMIIPRQPVAVRRFDAGSSRRLDSASTIGPLNPEILASAAIIRRRSAYHCRNNPWLVSGVNTLVSNTVGYGIRPTSKHPDPAVRKALQAAFDRWTAEADADGTLDFYGLQAVAARQLVEAGEVFAQLLPDDTSAIPLRVRLIDADLVDAANTRNLGSAGQVVGGIEINGAGRRAAYYVTPRRPTDLFATSQPAIRVPAADMLHLFQPLPPGQVRGVAWTAPVLLRLAELDESRMSDYFACEWHPPAQEWIDPLKDQEAEALAVASGFKSRRQVVAAQGYDVEVLDAEIAADHAREAALGLTFPAPQPTQPVGSAA